MGGIKKIDANNPNKRPPSRPLKDINWAVVDELMMSGCTGAEIAANFGIHPHTFFARLEKEYKCTFSAYCQEKRSRGDALIKRQQFLKALGKTSEGDNTMLVWLGKNRLNQKENPDQESNEQSKEHLKTAMDLIDALQKDKSSQSSSILARDDNSINNET